MDLVGGTCKKERYEINYYIVIKYFTVKVRN
jgi:hypothetical protein